VFEAAELSFHLSLSVGLEAIDGTCPPEVVLSRADAAMYQAKAQGGNRVVQYAPKTDGATPETYGGWFHYWIPEGH
jgi:PleD family two-component response regulator